VIADRDLHAFDSQRIWHMFFRIMGTSMSGRSLFPPITTELNSLFNMNKTSAAERLTHEQTELIQELVNCALSCEACASSCLSENDVTMMTRCIELSRDCAETCLMASRLVMRDSEISEHFVKVCEEVCRLCADECNKHEHEHCKICAEACDSCANTCLSHGRRQ
jgi:hypothetical protein